MMAAFSSSIRPMCCTRSPHNSFVAQFIGENNTLEGHVITADQGQRHREVELGRWRADRC
jgi:ABC-type Fe3+/spermidine/putrescine transport system ATPase subunit